MKQRMMPRPAFWEDARLQKRNHPSLMIELLIFLAVFLAANFAQSLIFTPPLLVWLFRENFSVMLGSTDFNALYERIAEMMSNLPSWLMTVMLFSFAGIIAVSILHCRCIEKRKLATMGLCKKHAVTEYLLGLGIGLAMFSAVFGLSVAFGGYRVTGLVLNSSGVALLILTFFGFVIQGAAEELLVRGYFATSLGTKAPVWIAVIESSLMFALMHGTNSGMGFLPFLNITLCGVFFCCYMLKRNSIWGACAIHTMWNFTQGCVFGLNVSGLKGISTILGSEMTGFNRLLTGGEFGPEGSLCTTLVMLAAIAAVLYMKPKAVAPPLQFKPTAPPAV